MPTLYLLEQGSKIFRNSERIVIEKDGRKILEIPEFKVERIFIFGNVQITTQALRFLLLKGKDVSFFNIQGRFIGKVIPSESKNVFLRLSQYEAFKDTNFRLNISKSIVKGKIKNCRTVLSKFYRNHPEVDLREEIERLSELLEEVDRKQQVSSLIGLEGMSTKIYFMGFSKMIRKKEFEFKERTRHPPLDPVNSLLSLGYSLITSEMFSVIFGMGLDPYVGFLHSLEYSRPSLALDLIEEFRPVIVDRLVLDLINKEMLKKEDFEYVETEEGKILKVLLNPKAKSIFFTQYEKRMGALVALPEGMFCYRRLFEVQVKKMIEAIKNKKEYEPFLIR